MVDIDDQETAKLGAGLEKLKAGKLRDQNFAQRLFFGAGAEENSLGVCDVASESAVFGCGFA